MSLNTRPPGAVVIDIENITKDYVMGEETVHALRGVSLEVQEGEFVWFDAHPDLDTPDETGSGYFDVNGVAILAGQCWKRKASNVPAHKPFDLLKFIYVGLRDFSPGSN